MSTLNYEDVPKKRLGEALEAARTMIGLTEQEAADALGISVRKLRHWEQGRKAPAPDMADAIGAAYGLDLGGNLPPRVPILFDVDAGGIVIADRVVPYIPGLTDNDDFLEGYVKVVRELRGLEPDTPIQLRSTDIQVLATVLDLTDDDLEDRLAFWMGQPAGSMIGVRHRLVLAAVVVGVVGGATAGAFMADASVAAEADDDGAAITMTLDDDLHPDAGFDTDLGSDLGTDLDAGPDIGTSAVQPMNSVIEMDLDDGAGGLLLDFSGIEGDGFEGLDLDLDLSDLDLDVDGGGTVPGDQPGADTGHSDGGSTMPAEDHGAAGDTAPAPTSDTEPAPADSGAAAAPAGDPEPTPEAAPNADTEPTGEASVAPAADSESGPTPPAGDGDSGDALVSLGGTADSEAIEGELSGSPTVDDWVADGFIDESEDSLVNMLDLVEDDGPVDPPIPSADDADVAGPEADAPADDVVAPEPSGDNWNFDGTREWVRQNLDGGWVDGWQGDGVALTGTELWSASSGDTSIDLNADGPGWFGRSMDTVEGETYEISFDMSGNPHGQRGVKSLNLTAGDEVGSFDFNTAEISRNDMQWQRVTMTFTADADTTWISFDSTTPGSVGAVIDNISVTPVTGA